MPPSCSIQHVGFLAPNIKVMRLTDETGCIDLPRKPSFASPFPFSSPLFFCRLFRWHSRWLLPFPLHFFQGQLATFPPLSNHPPNRSRVSFSPLLSPRISNEVQVTWVRPPECTSIFFPRRILARISWTPSLVEFPPLLVISFFSPLSFPLFFSPGSCLSPESWL